MPPHPNAGIVALCRPDGTLFEILVDEFELKQSRPSDRFVAMFEGPSASKAARFLRAAARHRSALDWQMDLALPHGSVPLFFSGIATIRGILILGAREPLSSPARGSTRLTMITRSSTETGQASILEATAHDLRNPVSGILAASEFLIDDINAGLEEHHLNLLRSIQASSRFALGLIDDMLETALEAAGPANQVQFTNLVSLVNRSVSLNRPLADVRNIRLEVTVGGPVPPLHIDPRKMAQAVHTLLKNEIKCSRPGSRIGVSVDVNPGEATVTVRDQGPGISAADLRRLFDPFGSVRPKRGLLEART